jgi:Mn-dependent DtxR family transcriptional regulator
MRSEYQTFSKYQNKKMTAAMEDYLEMIYRLSLKNGYVRLNELAFNLNVSPPSATKMMQKLAHLNYLQYHKYGLIILENKGKKLGKNLLDRHNTIFKLLQVIGIKNDNLLRETEKMEHTLSKASLKCIKDYLNKLL